MMPVLDSNIIIDCLRGYDPARNEMKRYPQRYISIITWIEVMAGAGKSADASFIRAFLRDNLIVLDISLTISEHSAHIRQHHRLKLPDAIIWATAKAKNATLITRNTKDFPAEAADIRIPYRL